MIIKNNLASVPVKNYFLFMVGCVLLTIVVVGFTAFNAIAIVKSYQENNDLREAIYGKENQILQLQEQGKILNGKIAEIKTPKFVSETEFMNRAIQRRMFSWTALFDHFEQILPINVKMISISPSIGVDSIGLQMRLAAVSLEDLVELVAVFENDPAFSGFVLKDESEGSDGLVYFSVSFRYEPPDQLEKAEKMKHGEKSR